MKKVFCLSLLLPTIVFAQNFHFSARLGAIGYQGDLKAKSISIAQSRLMGSLGGRFDLSEHISARTYFTFGGLKADDKKGTAAMKDRNLNFKTALLDWELGLQYNIFSLNDRWYTPYIFAGIGAFHFNPYTKNPVGDKTFLKPLSTEGQGFILGINPYKLTQISIPFGFGLDYSLDEDQRVGIEFGYRKVFTDYLDDVSTNYADQSALLAARGPAVVELAWRGDEVHASNPYPPAGTIRGNPKYNDGYYYVAVTYTIRYFFDKYKQIAGLPTSHHSKKVGCPTSRGY